MFTLFSNGLVCFIQTIPHKNIYGFYLHPFFICGFMFLIHQCYFTTVSPSDLVAFGKNNTLFRSMSFHLLLL